MKRIVMYCLLLWCLAGIAVAGYDTNIGAFQKDSADSDYYVNIGADQTDEAAATGVTIPNLIPFDKEGNKSNSKKGGKQ